jgi:hypothetical protein
MSHTSEQRWRRNQGKSTGTGLNDQVADLSLALIDVLYRAEKLSLELEELIDYTNADDKDSIQPIADQLFYEDWVTRETAPIENPGVLDQGANDDECQKVSDAVAAIEAAKDIFDFAKATTNGKSKISTLRRMG